LRRFAVIVLVAEASLALPSGLHSHTEAIVSAVLLAATFAAFILPWSHLPAWASVLVPLTYVSSVLALSLATGPSSGVGIVLLIPLVWAALFHRKWESATVVVAIVAVEIVVSIVQSASDSVTARRAVLWFLLASVVSVATHGLRDRLLRSQRESEEYQAQLREMSMIEDHSRIAAELQDQVIQRVFVATLSLQGVAQINSSSETRERLAITVENLDESIRLLRQAVFGLGGTQDRDRAIADESPPGAEAAIATGETQVELEEVDVLAVEQLSLGLEPELGTT
jgi:signal transduction histidine kinase